MAEWHWCIGPRRTFIHAYTYTYVTFQQLHVAVYPAQSPRTLPLPCHHTCFHTPTTRPVHLCNTLLLHGIRSAILLMQAVCTCQHGSVHPVSAANHWHIVPATFSFCFQPIHKLAHACLRMHRRKKLFQVIDHGQKVARLLDIRSHSNDV